MNAATADDILALAAPRPSFARTVQRHGLSLTRTPLQILQVNLTARCNLACTHCHVESGPKRSEALDARGIDRLIELLPTASSLHTLDLTGGAPELHPDFRRLAAAGRAHGLKVIDRCNLTVLFESGQDDTAEFLATQGIAVVASLPCYSSANVDKQRGKGVFGQSIDALQRLNALGYGHTDTGLELDLVYNPGGPSLHVLFMLAVASGAGSGLSPPADGRFRHRLQSFVHAGEYADQTFRPCAGARRPA
jgi:hypothetical protein